MPQDILALRRVSASGGELVPATGGIGAVDILVEPQDGQDPDVLLIAVGAFGAMAVDAAARLADQGIGVTVVDPRWALPVPPALTVLALQHRMVVTVEDGGRSGGIGAAVADRLAPTGVPVTVLALPQQFLEAASRGDLLNDLGLTAKDVARGVTELIARRSAAPDGGADPGGHSDRSNGGSVPTDSRSVGEV